MNISIVTKALQEQLQNDPDIASFMKQSVVRDEYINNDPNRTPLFGVYKGTIGFEPVTLGYQSFEATPSLRIIVQATSLKSGEDCSNKLDDYVDKVVDAVKKDRTIGGTVDILLRYTIDYGYIETDRTSLAFQSAIITLNLTKDDL